uniref:Glycolipid transfer protein a n=1 Tax=Amphiprion percula TaxID=161767 RepID=A0A3P8U7D4_AMPPE
MALLMEHQFRQLPADRQVETRPFLEAVSYLPPFFDCLGSTIFAPIKADISGNITKIKAVYDTNPGRFKTLQQIVEAEKEMGLRFIQVFLQSLVDGEKDESNQTSFESMSQKLCAALFAAPYKCQGRRMLEKIRKFLINFTATVDAIYEMYNKMNADLEYTM